MVDLALPVSIAIGLAAYGLIAQWYLMPALRRLSRRAALTPLVLLHTFRYVGLAFLIVGVTAEPLDPRFATPAAYGDLLAAALALLAVLALRFRWPGAFALTWVFNVVGFLDLLNALFQGLRYTEDGHLGATYFIPAVAVPALLVTHVMIFRILLREQETGPRQEIVPAGP